MKNSFRTTITYIVFFIITLFYSLDSYSQGRIIEPSKPDPNFKIPPLNFGGIRQVIAISHPTGQIGYFYKNDINCRGVSDISATRKLRSEHRYVMAGFNMWPVNFWETGSRVREGIIQITYALQNGRTGNLFSLTLRNQIFQTSIDHLSIIDTSPIDEKRDQTYKELYWEEFNSGGISFKEIQASTTSNGSVILCGLSTSGSVYINMQILNSWSGWKPLWGSNLKQITIEKTDAGRMAVFALSNDGSVFVTIQGTPETYEWGNWISLDGTEIRKIGTNHYADGRLVLFAIGGDHRIYQKEQMTSGGAWTEWTTLDGNNVSSICSEFSANGRLVLFALHMDGSIAHTWQLTPGGQQWSGWWTLGSGFQCMNVTKSSAGIIHLFAGTKNSVKHLSQKNPDGEWKEWTGTHY